MAEHSKTPGPESTKPHTIPRTMRVFPSHPVVSVSVRYHNPANTSVPTIQITPPTPPPPETTAIEVERTEPMERAYTLTMMQEVQPEEHEYREETGYGKKEQKGAFGLAMRKVSAKMHIGILDEVAKNIGDAMTRPWVIGCGCEDAEDAEDAGDEGKRIIGIGRYLFEVKEDESAGGADRKSGAAAGGSHVKKRGGEGSCGGGKS
ncbi:uncharacterized protein H6S33_004218 [Morchella sextelata]|uniref:uncharacterized protein n=1 Tax=Morchella sextelata TaxID=1174677 RepID=UPI001D04B38A|nr:uncharacterized protein H6S33_004218 [Morchella sextelata]KAH0605761.1 hypothetical protein H6S33_004218 [Morchella sextelata]